MARNDVGKAMRSEDINEDINEERSEKAREEYKRQTSEHKNRKEHVRETKV